MYGVMRAFRGSWCSCYAKDVLSTRADERGESGLSTGERLRVG